ncbi:MAG: fibronectin type III domain-containing protein, partial [Acidimicrobiia bacterium]|nr:fibronectin type III domain-containing protein [Acidimicrobiia bacterium]
AADPSGNQTASSPVDATTAADTTPPTTPGDLTAVPQSATSILLSWLPATDDSGAVRYRLLQDGVFITGVDETSFRVSGLTPETTYTFTVRAVDPAGNRSPWAGPVEATTPEQTASPILVAEGSVWRFLDNGSNQGTAWRTNGFDDSSWFLGRAELGYGDGDETTLVDSGPSGDKHITTYFRQTFTVGDPTAVTGLQLRLKRDDGAVAYLNGTEIARSNMPGGLITSSTTASLTVGGSQESTWFTFGVDPSLLVAGDNVLAVEIHQKAPTSSDITFDASLTAT